MITPMDKVHIYIIFYYFIHTNMMLSFAAASALGQYCPCILEPPRLLLLLLMYDFILWCMKALLGNPHRENRLHPYHQKKNYQRTAMAATITTATIVEKQKKKKNRHTHTHSMAHLQDGYTFTYIIYLSRAFTVTLVLLLVVVVVCTVDIHIYIHQEHLITKCHCLAFHCTYMDACTYMQMCTNRKLAQNRFLKGNERNVQHQNNVLQSEYPKYPGCNIKPFRSS